MIPKKILYTDGHEVTVTETFFQVRKSLYMLSGITKHGFMIIHPDRLPAFLVLLIGAMLITLGGLHMIPHGTLSTVLMNGITLNGNTIVLGMGIAALVTGALAMGLMRDRYAVRIATAEGEKNVLVSKKKEYIEQIVDALNRAFTHLVSPHKGWVVSKK